MAVLAVNSDNNEVGVRQGTTKLVRAFQRSKGFVQAVIRDATPAYIHDESTGSISKTAAFSIDKPRLNLAFEHIGRGLYYHHFGTRFNGSINVFPEFLLEPGQAIVAESSHPQRALREASRESFGGSAKFGANQKVFFYQIAQGPSTSELIVRLVFYGGSCVLLVFREFVASSR